MRRAVQIAVLTGGLAACAGGEERPDPVPPEDASVTAVPAAGDDLATSLIARVVDGRVRFALNVTNAGAEPIRLDFNSSQRFDVSVTDADGRSVWHWSANRSFIQVLGSETIEPGQTLAYDAEWDAPPPGTYTTTGTITASNRDIGQSVEVQIPNAGDDLDG